MFQNSTLAISVLVLTGGVCARNPPKQEAPPPPPIIVRNPDGTLTAQKELLNDGKLGRGLVIPKQVVMPFVASPQAPKH